MPGFYEILLFLSTAISLSRDPKRLLKVVSPKIASTRDKKIDIRLFIAVVDLFFVLARAGGLASQNYEQPIIPLVSYSLK